MTKDQALDWLARGIIVVVLLLVVGAGLRRAPLGLAILAAWLVVFWACVRLLRKADR